MCDAKVTYIEYHLESTYLESMVLPPLDGGTQQPTESRPKRWDIVGGGGAQGDHDGGGRCHIVSAVELGGKK